MRLLLPLCSGLVLLGAAENAWTVDAQSGRGDFLIVSAPAGVTGQDARLAARLQLRLSCRFQNAELREIADFVSRNTGVTVVIDPKLTTAQPVSITVADMRADRFLDWIAIQAGCQLSYLNEAAYFSAEIPRGERVTKVYEVTDLTQGLRNFPGPSLSIPEPGGSGSQLIPAIDAEQPRSSVEELADLVSEHLR